MGLPQFPRGTTSLFQWGHLRPVSPGEAPTPKGPCRGCRPHPQPPGSTSEWPCHVGGRGTPSGLRRWGEATITHREPSEWSWGAEGREQAGLKQVCEVFGAHPASQPAAALLAMLTGSCCSPATWETPCHPPSWWRNLATLHGSLQTHAKLPVPSVNQLVAFQVEDTKVIWDQDKP